MTPINEPFNRWVAASVILHAALFGAAAFGGVLFSSDTFRFGSADGSVSAIKSRLSDGSPGIELAPRPIVNPDSKPSDSPGWKPDAETTAKAAPRGKKAPTEVKPPSSKRGTPIPDPEADTKTAAESSGKIASAAPAPTPPNAVTNGNTGGTLDTTYGRISSGTGTASVGFSERTFGDRFGPYADSLTKAVSQYWDPAPGATSAPRVYVTFTINKDGSVTDLAIEKKSNNDALDNSAKRAVLLASASKKIPPLPSGFSGSSIKVRLSFEYTVR